MKYNLFTFKDNKLLCWRLGPVNAIKQVHYNKDIETIAGAGTHKPPCSRGFWAFPWPHYDLFFCYHQWKKYLPKKYLDKNTVLSEKEWEEYETLINQIRKDHKPSTFYCDAFYSHIFPHNKVSYGEWFYWDSPRDWEKNAIKTMRMLDRQGDEVHVWDYSKDHLEIFVP